MKWFVLCAKCDGWYALANCRTEEKNGAVYYFCKIGHHIATLDLEEVN